MSEPVASTPRKGLAGFIQRRPIASAVGALVLVGAGVSRFQTLEGPAPPPTAAPAPRDDTLPVHWPNSLAARFVASSLKDPQSAVFDDVTYRKRRGLHVLCGRVNAKNSFGGYAGFRQFIALNGLVQIHNVGQQGRWSRTWNDLCVKTDHDDPPAGSTHQVRTHFRPHHRATEASAAELKP